MSFLNQGISTNPTKELFLLGTFLSRRKPKNWDVRRMDIITFPGGVQKGEHPVGSYFDKFRDS